MKIKKMDKKTKKQIHKMMTNLETAKIVGALEYEELRNEKEFWKEKNNEII